MIGVMVFIIAGLVSTGVVLLALALFKKKITRAVGSDCEVVLTQNAEIAQAIDNVVKRLGEKTSFDEILKIEKEIKYLSDKVGAERHNVENLERRLHTAQETVDKKEAHQNQLKAGREDCDRVAGELAENKERLLLESERLKTELTQSNEQLELLAGELTLAPEQRAAFDGICHHLQQTSTHLAELIEIHSQSARRFLALQTQFDQLDKEYRNLVERQLDGAA